MKIALIRRQFAATGGAELYLQRLLKALAERGHELHLFASSWEAVPEGARVHPVPVSGSRAHRPLHFADAVAAELDPQRFDCVFSLERTRRQDVYRAGDGVHRVWLQRRREFSPWWKKPAVGLGAFHRNLLRLEAETFEPQNTRHIIVNSEMVRREILEHFPFPADRIHLVRNGVDVARFQQGDRARIRSRFGVKDNEFLLLFVGSGWERKGLKYLIRALELIWKQHAGGLFSEIIDGVQEFGKASQRITREFRAALLGPDLPPEPPREKDALTIPVEKIKLLVVGRGSKPAGCPDDVLFAGPMIDVEHAYAAGDLFVSLPIYEPSSNVIYEALAAGLPVITTTQNGAGEIVEEPSSGTLIENPADTASVARAIVYWWHHRFRTLPVRAAELNLDRNVDETLAILEMAAREKAR
jgi:UDP-glucose:(heptosyl)LPS alpha-1,3-glucosyltransferase